MEEVSEGGMEQEDGRISGMYVNGKRCERRRKKIHGDIPVGIDTEMLKCLCAQKRTRCVHVENHAREQKVEGISGIV